jgi:receptor protein-tyrosine kinase
VLRHKKPVLWTAGLGLAAALIGSAIEPRVYQAHASIQIQGVNENFLSLREIYPTAAPGPDNAVYVQTQAEMLRQDALIEEVVRKLHLEQHPELVPGSFWDRLGPKPDTWAVADRVKKNLEILPSRGSSIIQIVCEAREPQLSADLANTLAQSFIDQTVQARQQSAQQTYAALSKELQQLRTRVFDSRGQLAGTMDTNRQFYDVLSRRADEARLAAAVTQSNIRLVGPAQAPPRPSRPNIPVNLAIGLFGGLALGIAWAMLREQTDTVLRTPGEASAWLTLPELGVIPRAGKHGLSALGSGNAVSRTEPERALLEDAASGTAEAFRATLASVLASGRNGDAPRILLVTSPCPTDGKTTVVSNLGIALAEIGRKVLLIDADLRRPRLHRIFDQANSWGLSDLLREKNAVEDLPLEALVKKTAVPQLYLLPGGTSSDNIFALLWSSRMARLLPRFRDEFEYVLVDAPSCLEFADARILGRHAEALLLVLRADRTRMANARAAVRRLSLDRIPVMGAILNDWDPSKSTACSYAHYRTELA